MIPSEMTRSIVSPEPSRALLTTSVPLERRSVIEQSWDQRKPPRRGDAVERIVPNLLLLQAGKGQADVVFVVRSDRRRLDRRPGRRLPSAHAFQLAGRWNAEKADLRHERRDDLPESAIERLLVPQTGRDESHPMEAGHGVHRREIHG